MNKLKKEIHHMMEAFTSYRKKRRLIQKLGWQKMPREIAYDGIKRIVNNYICCLSDCCGIPPMSSVVALEDLLSDDISPDNVYLRLFIDDYYSLNDTKMHKQALSLKFEIEYCMQKGDSFDVARREWDI